eukprot:2731728-Lingulodinium_polyedra.AAC.1
MLPHRGYLTWNITLGVDDMLHTKPRTDEDLETRIRERYQPFIDMGLLVLARAKPTDGYYHASRAKHTSHATAATYWLNKPASDVERHWL